MVHLKTDETDVLEVVAQRTVVWHESGEDRLELLEAA